MLNKSKFTLIALYFGMEFQAAAKGLYKSTIIKPASPVNGVDDTELHIPDNQISKPVVISPKSSSPAVELKPKSVEVPSKQIPTKTIVNKLQPNQAARGQAAKVVKESKPKSIDLPKLPKDVKIITNVAMSGKRVSQKIVSNEEKESIAAEITNGLTVEGIIEQEQAYRYSSANREDPFLAPVVAVAVAPKQEVITTDINAEEIPIVSPLQYFSIKQLVVTGVWMGSDSKWKAMIETPDQQGIITKVNDAIGNSGGRITEISNNGVKVREYKLRKDGSQEFTDSVIGMSKEVESATKTGGVIILKPGASLPEMHLSSDKSAAETGSVPSTESKANDVIQGAKDLIKNNNLVTPQNEIPVVSKPDGRSL